MSEIHEEFKRHAQEDQARFDSISMDIKSLKESMKDFVEMKPQIKELLETQKEFLELWKSLSKGRKFLIGLATVIVSLVAVGSGVKTIFGWFK